MEFYVASIFFIFLIIITHLFLQFTKKYMPKAYLKSEQGKTTIWRLKMSYLLEATLIALMNFLAIV